MKRLLKPTRCSIPGCHHTAKWRLAEERELAPAIDLCNLHKRLHKHDKTFSAWEKIPIAYTPPIRIGPSSISSPLSKTRSRRRGKDFRRLLWGQFRDKACNHPYKNVRWDIVHDVARCLRCGRAVKRRHKSSVNYETKNNQKYTPILSPSLYRRKNMSIDLAMMMFFFQRGIIDTTWEDAIELARVVKPGSRFNAACFSFYRSKFVSRYLKRKDHIMRDKHDKKKRHDEEDEEDEAPRRHKKHKKEKRDKDEDKEPRETIKSVVLAYFDDVGVDEATYEGTKKRVLKKFPDSAFNESHMGWYRSRWHELND